MGDRVKQPSALSRTLSRAPNMTVPTVIAGQVNTQESTERINRIEIHVSVSRARDQNASLVVLIEFLRGRQCETHNVVLEVVLRLVPCGWNCRVTHCDETREQKKREKRSLFSRSCRGWPLFSVDRALESKQCGLWPGPPCGIRMLRDVSGNAATCTMFPGCHVVQQAPRGPSTMHCGMSPPLSDWLCDGNPRSRTIPHGCLKAVRHRKAPTTTDV